MSTSRRVVGVLSTTRNQDLTGTSPWYRSLIHWYPKGPPEVFPGRSSPLPTDRIKGVYVHSLHDPRERVSVKGGPYRSTIKSNPSPRTSGGPKGEGGEGRTGDSDPVLPSVYSSVYTRLGTVCRRRSSSTSRTLWQFLYCLHGRRNPVEVYFSRKGRPEIVLIGNHKDSVKCQVCVKPLVFIAHF